MTVEFPISSLSFGDKVNESSLIVLEPRSFSEVFTETEIMWLFPMWIFRPFSDSKFISHWVHWKGIFSILRLPSPDFEVETFSDTFRVSVFGFFTILSSLVLFPWLLLYAMSLFRFIVLEVEIVVLYVMCHASPVTCYLSPVTYQSYVLVKITRDTIYTLMYIDMIEIVNNNQWWIIKLQIAWRNL